jgi:hypothetical protein
VEIPSSQTKHIYMTVKNYFKIFQIKKQPNLALPNLS